MLLAIFLGVVVGLAMGAAVSWYFRDRRAAAQARRLAAHGHDLRGPLTAILGFSELMRDQAFGPMGSPRYAGYAKDIHASGRVLGNRIDAVMDLIRLDAGLIKLERGCVDVTAALEAVLAQAEARGHGPAELVLDLPEACPAIRGDRWAVERVFSLLLAGAAGRPATLRVAIEDGRLGLAWMGAIPDACGHALLAVLAAGLNAKMVMVDGADGITLKMPIAATPT